MKSPLVSIIVPTKNSADNLNSLLYSLTKSSYGNFEIIINDDKATNDNTNTVIMKYLDKLRIVFIQENVSMSQARKKGVDHAKGEILLHLDSDMQVTPLLLRECVTILTGNIDLIVIPEESFGGTFWARCKWLEKRMYDGVAEIESVRCMRKKLYETVHGHNENMIFSEDKDLDLRLRQVTTRVGRSKNYLLHNEGSLKLMKNVLKKKNYSNTSNIYAEAHPKEYRWQRNPLNRYWIYLKKYRYGLKHPILYMGVFYMKTVEYVFVGISMIRVKKILLSIILNLLKQDLA